MKFEYVNNYYGVNAELGRDVIIGSRLATITSDRGNYIGVTFHDDARRNDLPCHPTSDVIYLDSFTDLKTIKPKNSRSKQRYLDYLSADSSLSFKEWLGIV